MAQSSVSPSPSHSWSQGLRTWLHPKVLVSSLAAGGVTGLIAVIRAISYSSLIFVGPLAAHLSTGLGMTVFSTVVSLSVVALTSSLPGIISTPLAAPVTILAIAATGIAQEVVANTSDDVLPTVMVAIALTAIVTGVLLLVLGGLRQGERIRVIPYPVIGGFMAGTGWLLTKGFFQITTDHPLTWELLFELGQADILWRWGPGFGFAIAIVIGTRLSKKFWILPTVLLGCTASFFAILAISHISIVEAQGLGWFLGPFPSGGGLWRPITPDYFPHVHWLAIVHHSDVLLTVILVSLLSLLLSNSSIELLVGRDLDLSREMKAVGLADVVSGLTGGMVGSQAFPSTILVNNIGAGYRLTGLIATLPSIAVLAFGSSFLSYLPKAVLGSLILYLGISLLWKWLYSSFSKLPLSDYITVWITLVVIDLYGFLQGITVGFVLTVIVFMYRYIQVDIAKNVFSGDESRSNVERSPAQELTLRKYGGQIYALELQGFLFFGTANYLLSKVRDRATQDSSLSITQWINAKEMIASASQNSKELTKTTSERTSQSLSTEKDSDGQQPSNDSSTSPPTSAEDDYSNFPLPLRYVVIDFRQVIGLDSSAVLTFNKILRLANSQNFTVVLTNLRSEFQAELQQGQGINLKSDRCHVMSDLDRGLEWCEQQILQQNSAIEGNRRTLSEQLMRLLSLSVEQAERFMAYLIPHDFPAGHYIFNQGELRRELYFIESGEVSVLLELEDGRTKRLQTCSSGHLLGEMRFFNKMPLSSSVVTDTPSKVYSLSKETFEKMQQEAPDLVRSLQRHIVELLCESLIRRGEQLRVMQ